MPTKPTYIPSKPKSSAAARRLLALVYEQEGTWQGVANRLGLPSRGQAWKMAKGCIGDTPAMRAAIRKAEGRAAKAFAGVRITQGDRIRDHELVAQVIKDMRRSINALNTLLEDSPHEQSTNGK